MADVQDQATTTAAIEENGRIEQADSTVADPPPAPADDDGQQRAAQAVAEKEDNQAEVNVVTDQKEGLQEDVVSPPPTEEKREEYVPVSMSGRQLKQLLIQKTLQKAKKGNKAIPRLFSISNDLVRLTWNSKRKPTNKAQIPLSQIQEIKKGRSTESFRFHQIPHDENCCFSIIYTEASRTKTLDLVAPTPDEAILWVNGLLALTQSGVSSSTTEVRNRWLRSLFDEADQNGDGTLDLKEVINMMKKLNVGISNKVIKKKFKEADTGGNADNKLDFDEFTALFRDLADRPEMTKLFNLYASSENGDYMSIQDLESFLANVQSMTEVSDEYCQSVIERFEPSEEGKTKMLLSLDGFTQYMLSPDNEIFKRAHRSVYQDMTHPLSHYFIASSHNTYLLEDQLAGASSVDAYVRALSRGCRCVELDCWDGEDGEPIIYHGHTLTSKITFKDAITAIKDHSFAVSPYPVILSIENHCTVKQQEVMATQMIEIFGDKLYKAPRDTSRGVLPSPEDLKFKILVKGKKLSDTLEENSDNEGEVSDEDEAAEIDPEDLKKVRASSPTAAAAAGTEDMPTSEPPAAAGTEPQPEVRKIVDSSKSRKTSTVRKQKTEPIAAAKPTAKRKLSSKLSKCVNYVQSVHFKGFESTPDIPFFHMSSFGESSAFKSSDEAAASFMEYNKVHLSRIYPSGRRVDSSNYEPINMWNSGCQIVALNYQTPGKAMDWNIGKFQQNGNAGYILKPDIMREDYAYFDHVDKNGPSGVSPKVVTIRIISGQQLPKPEGGSETGEVIDPYVQVQFAGIPVDCAQYKTRAINDNGFNPVWNEKFQKVVYFPELALVRFKVMDQDFLQDDFIGQYTLPLSSMETGFRHIHLCNTNWKAIENATLFVEVTIEDWISPSSKSKEKLRQATLKKTRQYPSMKTCHFPQLDGQLKTVGGQLRTGIDLYEDYKYAMLLFKDACGKPSQCKMSDCIEAMIQQANACRVTLQLVPQSVRDCTLYQAKVTSPSAANQSTLKRMTNAFDQWNAHLATMFNLSPMVISELENILQEVLRLKAEFDTVAGNLPAKKAEQAKAAYSFNVRTLKNEISQLNQSVGDAKDCLSKVPTIAEKYSIEIVQTETPPAGEQSNTQEEKPKERTQEVAANKETTQEVESTQEVGTTQEAETTQETKEGAQEGTQEAQEEGADL